MKIPFVSFKPLEKELDKNIRDAFERVYSRSWYIEGVEDEKFEKEFAQYCDRKYCVGVGNGLDALFLSLKALGIKEGDEVIVPSILQRPSQLHMLGQCQFLLSRILKHLILIQLRLS